MTDSDKTVSLAMLIFENFISRYENFCWGNLLNSVEWPQQRWHRRRLPLLLWVPHLPGTSKQVSVCRHAFDAAGTRQWGWVGRCTHNVMGDGRTSTVSAAVGCPHPPKIKCQLLYEGAIFPAGRWRVVQSLQHLRFSCCLICSFELSVTSDWLTITCKW